MIKIEVDYDSRVCHSGIHKGIHFSVSAFGFKEDPGIWGQYESCATYILLTEEEHEKFKHKINDLPWNGGQTYYRKITEEHIDVESELKKKWDRPFYKIGDDFQHLWNMERGFRYDRLYLEAHIKKVIDALIGDSE